MGKTAIAIIACALLVATALSAPAQPVTRELMFTFGESRAPVPAMGPRVELLPVVALLGGEAAFSPAAGTYGVVYGDHFIQFAPGRSLVLVDGELIEGGDRPSPSPGGVAATVTFLERAILSPLGFHLEAQPGGYLIAAGSRYPETVIVRAAAADFDATTTIVLTLSRAATAEVTEDDDAGTLIDFADAMPQLDTTVPVRSRRVEALAVAAQSLRLETPPDVGLLSWHSLDDPPRIILELGRRRPTPTPEPVTTAPMRRTGPAPIVIDPGHGGDDTGAVAPSGLMEKDLVLAIARSLSRILEARGHTVRLTRDGDEARALTDRTALANRLEAVAFISLHANSSPVAAVRGAETYYMSLDRTATDDAAAATAEVENQVAGEPAPRSDLDLILWDLAQAEVLNESAKLALSVQRRLNERLGLRDRGVKQAPFTVLTGATMPAVLVEVGFLSNPGEEERLRDPAHQREVAEAIAAGIGDFTGRP